ncbi:MAG TPA: 4-alpha-glucanotransferase [Nocardioides sp.]|jgi:4-alpha-glucanotransferase|uniref:4-alpha-glucanotransferase n=1 Tax=Nocardioides sp. TaxID=35761 RepID=UPI002E34523F|nr:4-alpha-glucanotransferase [Nocardioides sp.]HEX3930487.1 4-alpha-glucanotransferase [Nocardioides sp.]
MIPDTAPSAGPLERRRAGVLLHVSSLPGGTLGAGAYAFVDFLAAAGCSVWQVLPLVPPGADGSPYRALSAMAGHPGLLDPGGPPTQNDDPSYGSWCEQQAEWLVPYVEYLTIRTLLGGTPWTEWEPALRHREPRRVAEVLAEAPDLADRARSEQWRFAQQWRELRVYTEDRGVLLYGDLPIFVAQDSADVWAHPDLFRLDASGRPTDVTGVPPDYFAADGQRWENPHYDWDAMAADGYAWWRRRIARQRELFDLVRIDHFRGFEAAWHVPVDAPTAKDGWWEPGPGLALLTAVVDAAGRGTLVAEDLGVITPAVEQLRRAAGLPGMKVLQFAFDGDPANPHLPAHHEEQSVVYTGTHDNDTTLGWWRSLPDDTRALVRGHLLEPREGMPWSLVRLAQASRARLVVVPGQDVLALGSEARMNTPGTTGGNWTWRARESAFDAALAARLREDSAAADRLAEVGEP